MIKKIHLENFMAHKATSIELAPGVTVITGPNNIGKSAVVEAIRYLVYNPSPKNVIRHGAKKALVRIELDSGESIVWQRQDKSASYAIEQPDREPEAYYKFGRDVPEDVRTLLRLNEVEIENEKKIDIHLGNQREPIFLLDRPGSHAAAFFAASSEADYLLKMQQALKRRVDLAKTTRKALDAELAAIARQLKGYEPLADLEIRLNQVEALYSSIVETEQQLPALENIRGELLQTQILLHFEVQAAAALESLAGPPVLEDTTALSLLLSELTENTRQRHLEKARAGAIVNIISPPDLAPTSDLEALLAQTLETRTHLANTLALARVLAGLTPPPATAEVENMQVLIKNYDETLKNIDFLHQRRHVLIQAAELPQLEDTESLEDIWILLQHEQTRGKSLATAAAVLAALPDPPEITNLHDLENILEALNLNAADLLRLQTQFQDLSLQLDRKQDQIQTYLKDTGACPLCGSPLNLEDFLEKRHAC
jgi:DNA repair exonuclease SbcCD ATPase subunit